MIRRRPYAPRLSLARHLGLYEAFHRDPVNRALHHVSLPLVVLSALMLAAYSGVGSALVLGAALVLAAADPLGAAIAALAGLGLVLVADELVAILPGWSGPAVAVAVHAAAWFVPVVLGHLRREPLLETGAGLEDSNLYFRRRHYLACGLGVPVDACDRLVQAGIAPLSSIHAGLVAVGLRAALHADVVAERDAVLRSLAAGRPPFEPHPAVALARRVPAPSQPDPGGFPVGTASISETCAAHGGRRTDLEEQPMKTKTKVRAGQGFWGD